MGCMVSREIQTQTESGVIHCLWWLVERHPRASLCLFAPKFWEGSGDPRMIFCQSMTAA